MAVGTATVEGAGRVIDVRKVIYPDPINGLVDVVERDLV